MRTHTHIYIPLMGSSPLPAKPCYKMTSQFSVASLYATNLQYRWHLHYRVFDHLFRPLRNFPVDLIPSVRLHLYYPCFKCHEQILQKSKFKIKLIFFSITGQIYIISFSYNKKCTTNVV